VTISGERIHFSGLTARLWGGTVAGKAALGLGAGAAAFAGELEAEGIELAALARAAGAPGSVTGRASGRISWTGEGLDAGALARSWELDLEGLTDEIVLVPERLALALRVEAALETVLGRELGPGSRQSTGSGGPGPVEGRPASPARVRLRLRRGRVTVEEARLAFPSGLALRITGSSGLDGRVAGWVAIERLPDEGVEHARRAALEELVRRDALRFAVTGTWAEPSVDVGGLLWLLRGAETVAGPGAEARKGLPAAPDVAAQAGERSRAAAGAPRDDAVEGEAAEEEQEK
jgi:hypothetical protein